MASYCLEKGTICDYADDNNKCNKVNCCRDDIGYIPVNKNKSKIVQQCYICGRGTDSINHIICKECLIKLKKMLYDE